MDFIWGTFVSDDSAQIMAARVDHTQEIRLARPFSIDLDGESAEVQDLIVSAGQFLLGDLIDGKIQPTWALNDREFLQMFTPADYSARLMCGVTVV